MRKHKTIQIDEHTKITVQELTVGQIIDLQERAAKIGSNIPIKDLLQEYIPQVTPGLTFDKLKELAPSEIKDIATAVKEVNADFLQTLDFLGIKKNLLDAVRQDFATLQTESRKSA